VTLVSRCLIIFVAGAVGPVGWGRCVTGQLGPETHTHHSCIFKADCGSFRSTERVFTVLGFRPFVKFVCLYKISSGNGVFTGLHHAIIGH
jgi:hypothetical protein